jgi:hypothetical protein
MLNPCLPRGALSCAYHGRGALRASLAAFAALAPLCVGGAAEAHARPPLWRDGAIASVSRGGGVLDEASRWIGRGNVTGRPGAWCAWFASFVLTRTGHRALASGLASSALSYGPRVTEPQPGDLAVMAGHVTFFAGWDGEDAFLGLGGNQSHRVSVARFARRAVIAFVRPT